MEKNKSKTWGCPRSCLHSLKKPDSCQQRYCYPKEMKRRKNSEKNTFFHTTYQLLPIFLPWHFCKTFLLTTKKKRHSNLYTYYSTTSLYILALLLCCTTTYKFTTLYSTYYYYQSTTVTWSFPYFILLNLLKMMSIFNQLVLDTKINVQHHHWNRMRAQCICHKILITTASFNKTRCWPLLSTHSFFNRF